MRSPSLSSLSTSLCLATLALCDLNTSASSHIQHVTAPLHERALDCLKQHLTSGTNTIEVPGRDSEGNVFMVGVSHPDDGGLVVYSMVHDAQGEQVFNLDFNPLYDTEPDGVPDAVAIRFKLNDTTWTPLIGSEDDPSHESIFNSVDAQRVFDLELRLFLQAARCTDGE